MKRDKSKSVSNAETENKALPQATFVDEPGRKNSSDTNDTDFEKWADFSSKVSGFGSTIRSEHNVADLLEGQGKDWVTVIPSDIIVVANFKYHVDELKKMLAVDLPKGTVSKLSLVSNNIRLFINRDKLGDLPETNGADSKKNLYKTQLIEDCYRNLAAQLNINKFPKILQEMAVGDKEFKLSDGNKILLDIDSKKFITNRLLPVIIKEESVKGYPLSNVAISEIKTEGDYVFFALTFKNTAVSDVVTINKKNFVGVNISTSHEKFAEIAKNYLDIAAAGSKVVFVDTNSLTKDLKGNEVDVVKKYIQTASHATPTTPVIAIEAATSLHDKPADEKVWKNPLIKLALEDDGDTRITYNTKTIKEKFATVLDGDVVEYVANGSTTILPNTKKLILASMFDGEIPSGIRVTYSSSDTQFGFALSV